MSRLYCHRNTYKILRDDIEAGWVRFVRYAGDSIWKIEAVSSGLPLMKSHFNADIAKQVLIEHGLNWVAGENIPSYSLS